MQGRESEGDPLGVVFGWDGSIAGPLSWEDTRFQVLPLQATYHITQLPTGHRPCCQLCHLDSSIAWLSSSPPHLSLSSSRIVFTAHCSVLPPALAALPGSATPGRVGRIAESSHLEAAGAQSYLSEM